MPNLGGPSVPATADRIRSSNAALMLVPGASRSAPGLNRCNTCSSCSGSRCARHRSNPSTCLPLQGLPDSPVWCVQVGQEGGGTWSSAWISTIALLYARSLVICQRQVGSRVQLCSYGCTQADPRSYFALPGHSRLTSRQMPCP